MCGVSGEVRWDGGRADVAAVARISDRLDARGPNGAGVGAQGPIALGHRRLAIIDLSTAGAQPMIDPELGLALVFNGCIYNYRALRERLSDEGYRFFSTSDTEVVLKAYHRWGARCVDHFLGMFAFAVAELATGRVVLARDRLGIKPLYLAESPRRLRFASSLPALLAAGDVDTSLDPVALHHYLSFHSVVPAPRTILAGVRKLPPATVRVLDPDGTARDTVYWDPPHTRDPAGARMSAQDWQEAVLDRLRLAVHRRMVADVPVGVLLSGGLDSSLVVALLATAGQEALRTFSIGFEAAGGESGDEFHYSDIVARHFATKHQQIRIRTDDIVPAVLAAVAAMSEPMVSHDCVAFHLLSREVAKDVRVVQSGQGADEVLAGYDWYPPLANVPRDQAADVYASVFVDRPAAAVTELLQPAYRVEDDPSRRFIDEHMARPGAQTALDAALRLDTQVMLVEDPVKRVDTMTMAWGLEARVPFLDHEFVELVATCPPALKLAHGGKGVLKDAVRRLLPPDVIDRPKGYFPVPAVRHLDGPLLEHVRDVLTGPTARHRGLYQPAPVARLLADPNATRTTLGSNALWQVALLEMWLQTIGVT
ncbi:MAG TPA: N-acetylglutaminylglutamine amidotransferase [Mycobacteriales bacterium]|nr:N-acetylglutaminylglutamine amidotransferase [Mycobacteriales bacterium]